MISLLNRAEQLRNNGRAIPAAAVQPIVTGPPITAPPVETLPPPGALPPENTLPPPGAFPAAFDDFAADQFGADVAAQRHLCSAGRAPSYAPPGSSVYPPPGGTVSPPPGNSRRPILRRRLTGQGFRRRVDLASVVRRRNMVRRAACFLKARHRQRRNMFHRRQARRRQRLLPPRRLRQFHTRFRRDGIRWGNCPPGPDATVTR